MSVSPFCARLTAGIVAVTLAASLAAPGAAQDATPAAGGTAFPIPPDPGACQIEPRSADELIALWYTPEGSPVPAPMAEAEATSATIPVGTLADEATTAEVIRTVSEVVNCFAAGDFPRATALFTENLVRGFGPEPGTTVEDARAFLEAPPAPEATEGTAQTLLAVTDVMDLGDGRVGAFIVEQFDGQINTAYVIFSREGDRLLADELYEFSPLMDEE